MLVSKQIIIHHIHVILLFRIAHVMLMLFWRVLPGYDILFESFIHVASCYDVSWARTCIAVFNFHSLETSKVLDFHETVVYNLRGSTEFVLPHFWTLHTYLYLIIQSLIHYFKMPLKTILQNKSEENNSSNFKFAVLLYQPCHIFVEM